ncbi:TagK domain-containing protein [Paraburkholderia sp. BCC1885]|uniref:TagK domain-containing protein n=1 Tax=Paraburkholderia sp. BCC1885 TaxID=2562669 RepID=UPI0011821301|nr:TagK domain-containing protein [Paraburkholderia sp. BCC1885]
MSWKHNFMEPRWAEKIANDFEIERNLRHAGIHDLSSGQNIYPDQAIEREFHAKSHAESDDAIYGLIGTDSMASAGRSDEAHPDDVIGSLHKQYWRALNDPLAPLGVDWAVPVSSAHRSLPESQREEPHECDSIETLLSGARGIDDAFGVLGTGEALDVTAAASAPEILLLFAPPEFKAAPSRLPPALARREHHAVGIDSPLTTQTVSTVSTDLGTDA